MSFKGKSRKHGRRWFSMDPHGKRGKRYWLVLGDFKLSDITSNAEGELIRAHIEEHGWHGNGDGGRDE